MSLPLGNYVPGLNEGTVKVQHDELDSEVIDTLDLLDNLPTSDQTDGVTVWNDNGTLKVSTSA